MQDEGDETFTPAPAVNPKLAALRARSGAVTVEEWAEAKGMLPEFSTVAAGRTGKATKQVHNRAHARFAAARGLLGWMSNSEVSETAFDAAVARANDPKQNTFR